VDRRVTNWAGNLTYEAAQVHTPGSVAELRELVGRLPRVKALGTRHSFSAIADSPGGALVSLAGLDPDLRIDPAARTASVTGGTSYGVLAAALQAEGWALGNLASLPHISVAGATATASHGSGDANQVLSASVAAVDIVKGDGSLVTVGRGDPDLAGLAAGLGRFGIVTRVTLDLQPSFTVRQDVYRMAPWDAVLEAFDEVMASAYSVSLMADYARPVVDEVWQKTRLGDGPPDPVPASRFGGSWADDAGLPAGTHLNQRGGIPGPWSDRLAHFRRGKTLRNGGDELQSEYFVGREHGVAALRALRGMGERISPHLHVSEVRTVAADELWLSPAYRRGSVCIGFTWRKHAAEVTSLLPAIEAALEPFAPRPHWGKLSRLGPEVLAGRFPRLADAAALAGRWDPDGVFANPAVDRLLGLG
jgi:xylitol oxidase